LAKSSPKTSPVAVGAAELDMIARSSPAGLAYVVNLDLKTGESQFWLPPHLALLNREIVAAAVGDLRAQGYRGIIFTVPPRHGKSMLTSHYTPPWFLGTWPDKTVGLASYEADFAATWGRRGREVLEMHGPRYFNVKVDQGTRASSYWRVRSLVEGAQSLDVGSMVTAGIGGPLTGRGVHMLIVDDPVKNAVEAHSKTKRESVWSWWTSTAATRIEPDGFAIIILTRWHDDDLAGRLLARQGEDGWKWKYINLPAIAVDGDMLGRAIGEALWPQRFPAAELAAIKTGLGSYVWNSLYQGMPANQTGGFFDTDWLKVVDEPHATAKRIVRYWDLAGTEAEGDYLAGVRLERLRDDSYYVADAVRARHSSAGVEAAIVDTARGDGREVKVRIAQERGASGKLFVDIIRRKLPGFDVRGDTERGDKELRARPLSAVAERGGLYVKRAAWTHDYVEEMVQFQHGANDDQVDATSGGFKALQTGGAPVII
jgi:predicted phage terminase large subunit-like protein